MFDDLVPWILFGASLPLFFAIVDVIAFFHAVHLVPAIKPTWFQRWMPFGGLMLFFRARKLLKQG